jgi:hypothetical protein
LKIHNGKKVILHDWHFEDQQKEEIDTTKKG